MQIYNQRNFCVCHLITQHICKKIVHLNIYLKYIQIFVMEDWIIIVKILEVKLILQSLTNYLNRKYFIQIIYIQMYYLILKTIKKHLIILYNPTIRLLVYFQNFLIKFLFVLNNIQKLVIIDYLKVQRFYLMIKESKLTQAKLEIQLTQEIYISKNFKISLNSKLNQTFKFKIMKFYTMIHLLWPLPLLVLYSLYISF